jgi:hypothetical protein
MTLSVVLIFLRFLVRRQWQFRRAPEVRFPPVDAAFFDRFTEYPDYPTGARKPRDYPLVFMVIFRARLRPQSVMPKPKTSKTGP